MLKRMIVVVTAVAVVGCGSSGSGTQQTPSAGQTSSPASQPGAPAAAQSQQQSASGTQPNANQAGQQLAQGLAQMAQGLQGLGQRGADGKLIPPVDFEKLEALLPAPAGWTKGKSKGQQIATIVSTSNAEVIYTKGEMNVHLEITDSAMSQILLAPLSMMLAAGYSERSSSGYKKSINMAGAPGFEEWDSDDKTGEITVVVGNRFIVSGKGSNLDSLESVRGIVSQVDLAKLGALK